MMNIARKRSFQNPATGAIETVGPSSVALTYAFGIFYFMAKGLWRHALGIMLVCLCGSLAASLLATLLGMDATSSALLILGTGFFTPMIYAYFAPSLISQQYLQKGWIEIPHAGIPSRHVSQACPQCAEQVRGDAKACCFCHTPIPAQHTRD